MTDHVYKLLGISLVFHVVFILSVFDCYFTSPVVHGMKPHSVPYREAKRLVLIIGDGLRADLLFKKNGFSNGPDVVAPYLRSIVETRGAFGVSHTRVPTESRPGHVAIIAGMYEDVSAVTKGWKINPVEFDSVFNRSSKTFSFGSPDILPMFARGATPGTVETWCYDAEAEDFTKDATALDTWVLDKFNILFQNATTNPILEADLRADKVIFFLHLLGLDTTGHSYRPHSPEYMNNIIVVDNIVRNVERLISDFYGDQETSFIFTADHGMSVIGNHGDGHPDNTRTPLVAWGKGIRGPLADSIPSSHDSYSRDWDLTHLLRRDLEQADIAALMSSLIGISWPVNSVGVLPDVDPHRDGGYLLPTGGAKWLSEATLVNAKVILEHYTMKHTIKSAHTIFYRSFKPLDAMSSQGAPGQHYLDRIERYLLTEHWNAARQTSLELIRSCLEGLYYLQVYDRSLIRSIVALSYPGWSAYVSLFVFSDYFSPMKSSRTINLVALTVLAILWAAFLIERSPWSYYVYVLFPVYFWREFFMRSVFLRKPCSISWSSVSVKCIKCIPVVSSLLLMVVGYTHRSVWSIGFLLMAVWPLFSSSQQELAPRIQGLWATLCALSAIFPLLDVNKSENIIAIMSGGFAILLVGAAAIYLSPELSRSAIILHIAQLVLTLAAMIITASSVVQLQEKRGLPVLNQISGWIVLCAGTILPFISRVKHTLQSKILMYFLTFGPCFVILSISVEGLFYVAFSALVACWVYLEKCLRIAPRKSETYTAQYDDARIVLYFLFFVQVGFFGTGNVASISSFYLSPVYRLIPVFEPFSMAVLLIFKIIAPYVILSTTFAALNHLLGLPPFSLFTVALMLTDVMTVTFFFNVVDTGSWLEIGQTISFFCIASLLQAWSAILCAAGEYFMADIFIEEKLHAD